MNKRKAYKLAVIGGGVESAVGYTHLIASQMDHRFQLVSACFSRKPEVNEKTVKAWNLDKIRLYDDWSVLLTQEKKKIDAVAILSPTPLHHEMVIEALKLGIPIICEKAMTSTYEEAQEICKVQSEYNGFLAVTHNYTGYPMLRELRQLVSEKRLGDLTQIQVEMPQEGFAKLDMANHKLCPQAWRLVDGDIPGVSLDLGTHLQHMIHYVSGENPSSLIADQNTYGWFKNIVDDVSILAHYPSGMKSSMWYGKSALGHRNGMRIRIYGKQGSAEWYQMEPEILIMHNIHGNRTILDRAGEVQVASSLRYNRFKSGHPAGFIEAFANLYVDIANKLDEFHIKKRFDPEWTYGPQQAAIGMKIFKLAKESSDRKIWMNVV
jgi:predicted dehydrogenase